MMIINVTAAGSLSRPSFIRFANYFETDPEGRLNRFEVNFA